MTIFPSGLLGIRRPGGQTPAPGGSDEPIRDAIFSLERLEQHASDLAAQHTLTRDPRRGRGLSRRLRDNARVLLVSYRAIVKAVRDERSITPAAEWLVDNFYVVDEQLREIVRDLPNGFYRRLPKLASGPLEQYPRVFGLAWAFVAHTDSRFDPEALTHFVRAYQRGQSLEIGELWALPITLRIVLIENLRRLSERVLAAREAREEADRFADDLLGLSGRAPQPLTAMLERLERRVLPRAFVVQLTQRMREQREAAQVMHWLETRLSAQGTTPDEAVTEEYQSQGAANVTVRNVITSMRLISAVDWAVFFESVSAVDEVLRECPGFALSDFATRDRYRHAVEELARGSDHSEVEIARFAVGLASNAGIPADATITRDVEGEQPGAEPESGELDRLADPGHYLISSGRGLLERTVGFRVTPGTWLFRAYRAAALPGYLGTITLVAVAIVALGFLTFGPQVSLLERVALMLLALIPASDLALALVNGYVTAVFKPRALAKLELKEGVPASLRTVIAVPTLLTSRAQVLEELERLEVRYLANASGDLRFALLGDFSDAPSETMPDDEALLDLTLETLRELNQRHGAAPGEGSRFLLFHRNRLWSESEQTWMGWERKRGKLHEFNRLLRGATDTSFVGVNDMPLEVPSDVRFVITLDADTRLPRDAACRLVGAMAHPLNRPRLDPTSKRVIEGYAILQPRITLSLPAEREGTVFQQVFSSHAGMDPYASAVSDVYQDLFGEGSYAGKGIYDVDAFETALSGRVPETALLSHDLFEGLFARAGLVSDVELVEEYPSHYGVRAARQHRWVRGDWQLLPWVFSSRAPISTIGRWKLLDNLRRSLSPIALLLALVGGWVVPGVNALGWTGFILGTMALPVLMPFFTALTPPLSDVSRRSYALALGEKLALGIWQLVLSVTLLADQTWLMLDAIIRTLGRVFVTRQNLLEWRTAAQSQSGADLELPGFYRRMIGAPAIAIASGALVLSLRSPSWPIALPFVALWVASPIVARWASLPRPSRPLEPLPSGDRIALRGIARRTWRFFERFVGPEDHYLPPDNFQEDPQPKIAHRTSPTNIGLALLSTVSAHDFGWIGALETVERLELMLDAIESLELYRGHLYNWYDTQSLQPLEPRYVSTVDSGNLAGHLIALSQACLEMTTRPLFNEQVLDGVHDTLRLARTAAARVPADQRPQTVNARQLAATLDALESALASSPADSAAWALRLETLARLSDTLVDVAGTLVSERGSAALSIEIGSELNFWARAVRASIQSHIRDLPTLLPVAHRDLVARLESLAMRSEKIFAAMGFGFLFDGVKKLFSIGLDTTNHRLDPSSYDLLASEARLTSFIAIAKDEVPTSHWFHLGRELTPVDRGTALVSWSGSMFEYLMPRLVMRSPPGSLLEETCHLVVRGQIAYGAKRSTLLQTVPWGISESAFAARDLALNYQYLAFGVPGLGLKRGLGDDLVIAPYATALAAMIDPVAATRNLALLETMGASGTYGFYDALDFTSSRQPEGARYTVVRNFMAHHSGMALVALANVLLKDCMTDRFHADARVQSAELLLQERTPRDAPVARPRSEEVSAAQAFDPVALGERSFTSVREAAIQTHLLSNGRYTVMLTVAGSGYSRWNDLAVTRWREDTTRDAFGSFIYLHALPDFGQDGRVWSATPQPLGLEPEGFEARFFEDRAEFMRRDGIFETKLEVIVSPEDDAEMRRVSITNHGSKVREIELTSYAEVVLAPPAADDAHPAFAKLFVQTEFVPGVGALLATRRPRSPDEPRIWAAHTAVIESVTLETGALEGREPETRTSNTPQFETDRARFLGRGFDVRKPASVMGGGPLSGTVGAVLDPVFSLRRRVRLEPGATARVTFTTLTASTREAALEMADRHRDPEAFERGLTLAWTRAQVESHHLGIASEEAHVFQRLASSVLYLNPSTRPSSEVLGRNTLGQPALWRHGISGDLPMVLVRIDDASDLEIVRQILRAHEYWRTKRLAVDLVILNEQATSYMQELQEAILGAVRSSQATARAEDAPHGSVYTLRADLLSSAEQDLLRSTARIVLLSRQGTLSEQVARNRTLKSPIPQTTIPRSLTTALTSLSQFPARRSLPQTPNTASSVPQRPDLEFFNGLGGFSRDGLEYVIVLGEGQWTPAPWINVIANPDIGFTVSESGSGYTWAQNSRENKLTPWSNDPVSDPVGEAIYIRDEDTLEVFTATPLPIREDSPYEIRHGQGYTNFAHDTHGIHLELTQFVPTTDPVKISRLSLENRSSKPRRLSVTAYLEWVLGTSRESSAPHIITELDPQTNAILARNHWSDEFGSRVAFVDLMVQWQSGTQARFTCDRSEFIGRHGSLERPAALEPGGKLSGRIGAGLDPCAALQTTIELAVGARIEVVVLLGQTATLEEAQRLISFYRNTDISAALETVKRGWNDTLGAVRVSTPNRAMDLILNRWLPYQTLSSRIWARTGFYQAGGAYGFRDQLQDTMALAAIKPDLAREQILRAASHQFLEGDVQHWWHPPSGRGVRTHISDDLVWLPYAISHYLEVSGDARLLDEPVGFIEGPSLEPEQEDSYYTPRISPLSATLFEHGARALEHSLSVGVHGLPLIGSGDWNDGMNRVGREGKGESVWMGWFLHANLTAWAKLAEVREERERARVWRQHAGALKLALETHGWDGDWYKRAFYDDGTPLGSAQNEECRIDSIAQSWAVISGAGESSRAARAMAALEQHLVKRDDNLVLLFTPPFEHTERDPGYIKGYLPGVRENGGQYTHAAVWTVLAFAMLGEGDKAFELFSMLNPINRSTTRAGVHRYKVEPYVISADVYAQEPHVGRGGWTWYTGSSGWLYRVGIEAILGFKLRGDKIEIDPCIPRAWVGYQISFAYHSSRYEISIENPQGVTSGVRLLEVDGKQIAGSSLTVRDDGLIHRVRVVLG